MFDGGQLPPPPQSPSQLTPDGNLDLKLQTTCLAGSLAGCLPDCLFGLSTVGIALESPQLISNVPQ